jgi:hypothetical protein
VFDPHGGPKPPVYDMSGGVASELNRYVTGGANLRFGTVTAINDQGTHDTATVTVDGIRMPFITRCNPQIGDNVAWIDATDSRIVIGKYGPSQARIRANLATTVPVAPNSFASPSDILWDGNSVTNYQHNVDHSTSFLPALFGITEKGSYHIAARVEFGGGDGNVRGLVLKFNGSGFATNTRYDPNVLFPAEISFSDIFSLNAGDNVSLAYIHNASGNININAGALATYISIRKVQPYD